MFAWSTRRQTLFAYAHDEESPAAYAARAHALRVANLIAAAAGCSDRDIARAIACVDVVNGAPTLTSDFPDDSELDDNATAASEEAMTPDHLVELAGLIGGVLDRGLSPDESSRLRRAWLASATKDVAGMADTFSQGLDR